MALRRWLAAGGPIHPQTLVTVFLGTVALRRWPAAGNPTPTTDGKYKIGKHDNHTHGLRIEGRAKLGSGKSSKPCPGEGTPLKESLKDTPRRLITMLLYLSILETPLAGGR